MGWKERARLRLGEAMWEAAATREAELNRADAYHLAEIAIRELERMQKEEERLVRRMLEQHLVNIEEIVGQLQE